MLLSSSCFDRLARPVDTRQSEYRRIAAEQAKAYICLADGQRLTAPNRPFRWRGSGRLSFFAGEGEPKIDRAAN
jgi:hypothetical protein